VGKKAFIDMLSASLEPEVVEAEVV
jgi:hypothetical protein